MSNKIKLSPAACELYAAMQKGVTCSYSFIKGNAVLFRSDTLYVCTKQAVALINAGLVEKFDENMRGYRLRVKKENEHVK